MHRVARLFALVLLAASGVALGQGYPNKPIKVIVPWPPGQATDTVARVVTEKMSTQIGQQLVIDNRGGAGGVIGTDIAAKSPPDGYTILAGSSGPISISPRVQKVPYDPDKDFEPICIMASSTYVLVAHPSVPAKDFSEFVALLKANPGKYNFASSGTGATAHLAAELFNSTFGLSANHVPYKGSAPAVTDLIAGHVSYAFETAAAVLPHIKAGKLKAFAVSSPARSIIFPDLPTIIEAGQVADFDVRAWIGLIAPTGIPSDARQRLARECQAAVSSTDVKEKLLAAGLEPDSMPMDEIAGYLRKVGERFGAVARAAKIRLD
jgi:tripartite-type tricarboxylate transporter receptor subunit TctC